MARAPQSEAKPSSRKTPPKPLDVSHRKARRPAHRKSSATPKTISWTAILQEARERFGIRRFRPGQRELLEEVLHGRSALGLMPTGSGKSLLKTHEDRATHDKDRLAEMMHHAETVRCRVQGIRAYFSDPEGEPCNRCDNCRQLLGKPAGDTSRTPSITEAPAREPLEVHRASEAQGGTQLITS